MNSYSTNCFKHVKAKKMFTTTNDYLPDLNLSFTNDDIGKTFELESTKTSKVSLWTVDAAFFFRNGRTKNLRLVPTEETLKEFPQLKGYRMFIFYNIQKNVAKE